MKGKRFDNLEDKEHNIRVLIRTRPTPNFSTKNINLDSIENMVSIHVPKTVEKGLINSQKESWTFKFDKILHNISQDDMFEYSARQIIEKSVEGQNGTVFAYGQTGSGKTFTMSGTSNNYSYRGLIPRAITGLFQEIGKKPDLDCTVKVSYLEIYNETFYDLLSTTPSYLQKGDISLLEDYKGNLNIKGLSIIQVNNEEEAFNLFFEGDSNKTISLHHLNKESSRSHCIFTMYLEIKSRIESSEKVKLSKINFVDLAGSERVKNSGSTGITLKEANYINKSLTFLEQVVISLTEKSKSYKKVNKLPSIKGNSGEHIPYRQSKLTHLLKDSIGGNCNTIMICTIIPEESHLHETLSSLYFAKRMMYVENEVSVNTQLDIHKQLKNYARENKQLKQELAMFSTLNNRGRINYEPYTPEEQYSQNEIAKKFLTGKDEDLEFESIRQAKELFNQCRILYQRIWDPLKDEYNNTHFNEKLQMKQASIIKDNVNKEFEDGKGEFEYKSSFGLGKAGRDARPINKLEVSQNNFNNIYSDEDDDNNNVTNYNMRIKPTGNLTKSGKNINNQLGQSSKELTFSASKNVKDDEKDCKNKLNYNTSNNVIINDDEIPDKKTAFNIYKLESKMANDIRLQINTCTNNLKTKKEEAKNYFNICNDLKNSINITKKSIEDKKACKFNLGDEMTNIIDQEEFNLYTRLKHEKDEYKKHSDLYKECRTDIDNIKEQINLHKVTYIENFENWFFKRFGIKLEDYELKIDKGKYGVKHEIEMEENKIIDDEQQAYFNAKYKVASINRAKKLEKILKK